MPTTVEETEKIKTGKDKNSELLLDSLEIKGYRCFEHLTIEKLGRVNLIVGKNNVGKTALLEALWIYSNGATGIFENILSDRDEDKAIRFYNKDENAKPKYRHLFYKRLIPNEVSREIKFTIGSLKKEENFVSFSGFYKQGERIQYFRGKNNSKTVKNEFIKVKRLEQFDINVLWDEIANTQSKKKVFDALQILEEGIIEVNVQPFEYINSNSSTISLAQIENHNEPLPLKSFGEGLNRIFEIVLILIKCAGGIVLIDEIENGLHYSVLLDIWRLIFTTATNLNVQVFATTHSLDCVKAFQRAAEEDKEDEGVVIRLVRKNDKIKAILFDEEELETVVENDIEVR